MKINKGDFGYVESQKRIRLLRSIGMFAVDLAIFFVGLYLNKGDRKNIYTVIAAVGCIPASMQLVSFIMMARVRPISLDLYQEVKNHADGLNCLYELYLTTNERNIFLDAIVVSGEYVIAYTGKKAEKGLLSFMESHIRSSILNEGLNQTVKIFDNKKNFLERVDQLAERKTADEETAERENTVLSVIKLLSI